MQTIIVATNFSNAADNALIYATEALFGKNYQIVIFNYFSTSIHVQHARLPAQEVDRLTNIRKEKLGDIAKSISSNYGLKAIPYLASGNLLEQLENCIKAFNAEMVVIGMAEKSFEQDLLGNTTTMLINKLQTPVLSIPSHLRYKEIKKILFACDVLRGVHKNILENVRNFAQNFGAKVEVFHVRKFADKLIAPNSMESILNSLEGVEHSFVDVHAEVVIKAIEQELESSQADILVMVPYKYGFWSSMIHKSLTRTMASESEVPLLSIHLKS
ncbi:universal stress protein [Sphingobacterium sp. LRF_L2]|uniref:universal stress protein n=1 Tax=Sphingobacterium sp. LRF_L2 TaxID=3369421 RepID=UPI003F60DD16